jgi:hypothetical protein
VKKRLSTKNCYQNQRFFYNFILKDLKRIAYFLKNFTEELAGHEWPVKCLNGIYATLRKAPMRAFLSF